MDEAEIIVEGGRGGDGCASFKREKYRPRGGPDGGDGGRGGDVVLEVSQGMATLSELNRRRRIRAGAGGRGGSRDKKGRAGEDRVVGVPAGTVVRDGEGRVLADLVSPGQRVTAARGGRGGKGNSSLKGPAGQLPSFAEKGEGGEERTLKLELKSVADVAIVGYPNAGKSTLISRISKARPKIADYPFTTLEPHLGFVEGERLDYVVTDVPGLVDGAHEGKGMGLDFLRHIERASSIILMVDASQFSGREPVDDMKVLRSELGLYDPGLAERAQVVAANKMDLGPESDVLDRLEGACREQGLELYRISAVTGEGISGLMRAVESMVGAARESRGSTGVVVEYGAPADEEGLRVTRDGERFRVSGARVERMVRMTDWGNDEARAFLAERLRRAGVEAALASEDAQPGAEVEIAGRVFEFYPDQPGKADGGEAPGIEEDPKR